MQNLYTQINETIKFQSSPMKSVRAAWRVLARCAAAWLLASTLLSANASAAGWTDLGVGEYHACAVRDDGSLWCFNHKGTLGTPAEGAAPEIVAEQVDSAADWAEVTTGAAFTCALKTNRSLWCWGSNNKRQLKMNLGPVKHLPIPLQSGGRRDWTQLQAGNGHICGLHTDSSLDCWGSGAYPAPSDMRFRAIGSGYQSTCAIREDGTLWCWGDTCRSEGISGPFSCWGELPSAGASTKPGQIGQENDWVAVSAGSGYACGIRADKSLWCWGVSGSGVFGKLGQGFWPKPVQIDAGPWSQVAVDASGGNHTCGIRPDNSLWCWGQAGAGYYGGAPSIPGDAVEATPHGQWAKVSVNRRRICGIRLDGSLWCWGEGLGASGGIATPPGVRVAIAPLLPEPLGTPLPGADWRPSAKPESPPKPDSRKIVTVDNTKGLLAALGSHRTIILLPGEYSLPHIKPGKSASATTPHFASGTIQNLTDLAIVSAEPGGAVFTPPDNRADSVLAFNRVKGLRLEGLRIENAPDQGGGIVLNDCQNVRIVNSVIAGGWMGVHATQIDGLELDRTTVRFIDGAFMGLNRSRGVVLRSSLFTASTMFNFGFNIEWSDVLFDRSALLHNGRMERTGKSYPIFLIDEWAKDTTYYSKLLPTLSTEGGSIDFINRGRSRVELSNTQIKESGNVLATDNPRAIITRDTIADFKLPTTAEPDSADSKEAVNPLWAVRVYYKAGEKNDCNLGEAGGPLPTPPQALPVPLNCLGYVDKLRVTLIPWLALDSYTLSQCEGTCDANGKGAWRALKATGPLTFALRPVKTSAVRLLISKQDNGVSKPLQEIQLFHEEQTD